VEENVVKVSVPSAQQVAEADPQQRAFTECRYFHSSKARCRVQLSKTLGGPAIQAMEIVDVSVELDLLDRAKDAVGDVLKRSSHKDPLLAINWHGSSGEAKRNTGIMGPSVWHWGVCTHERTILDFPLNPYLIRWEHKGFTFHTQTQNVEWAMSQLNQIYIDTEFGEAKCFWKGGKHEAITCRSSDPI
jgi:hypothetical protein